MSYKDAVIDYVEQNGGKNSVTAPEVAAAVGCSEDTVYRHWGKAAAADAATEVDRTTDVETDEAGPYDDDPEGSDGEEGTADLTSDDVAGVEEEDDPDDDDPEDMELDDDEAKTYECGECDADLDYLQKQCECGARPAWSAIEGAN